MDAYDSNFRIFATVNGEHKFYTFNKDDGNLLTPNGIVLDTSNYQSNVTNLTGGLTVYNGGINPLTVHGTTEASIKYYSNDGNADWIVGKGVGSRSNFFGIWDATNGACLFGVYSDGTIASKNSTVVTKSNFSYSNGTLTITM